MDRHPTGSDEAPESGTALNHLRVFASGLATRADEAVSHARAQGVPVAVLDGLDDALAPELAADERWQAAVLADAERTDRLARVLQAVDRALAGTTGVACCEGLLGPGWSADVDVYVQPDALEPSGRSLREAGAIGLDGLQAGLRGAGAAGLGPARHFAMLEDGLVLGAVELLDTLWAGGASAAPAVERASAGSGLPRLARPDVARRRLAKLAAARRPTVRGLLELVVLLERGVPLPRSLAGGVLRRHVALERALGGPGAVSEAASEYPWRPGAAAIWAAARVRAVRRESRNRLRRRRPLIVAFCGVDGAGKSTQVALLVSNLERGGVPARSSWTRLGNKASSLVAAPVRFVQRLLPRGTHSFETVREETGRRDPDRSAATIAPLTRRGAVGWSWALVVTVDYILRARAARRRARGEVLVLDRALPDALVDLQDNYGVVLSVELQRQMLERWAPRPDVVFYLQLSGATAKARKDDVFTAADLEIQRGRYEGLLEKLDGVVTLDARRSPADLAADALGHISAMGRSGDG